MKNENKKVKINIFQKFMFNFHLICILEIYICSLH